jgi:hypothetical protein
MFVQFTNIHLSIGEELIKNAVTDTEVCIRFKSIPQRIKDNWHGFPK